MNLERVSDHCSNIAISVIEIECAMVLMPTDIWKI